MGFACREAHGLLDPPHSVELVITHLSKGLDGMLVKKIRRNMGFHGFICNGFSTVFTEFK